MTDTKPHPDPQAPRYRPLLSLSDRAAHLFGLTPQSRTATVHDMLVRYRTDRVKYWFQLIVAMGIATLGLVLNSTAVVIGAMLVSPLMGPIVGIGMALATGSPDLTLRAFTRLVASIVGVVGGSALLARSLPFHEVTAEIAARTTPTLLDLIVAGFCALIAGFVATRPASDDGSTAAGAAIGIALVPPLCVVGFGLGESQYAIAYGAALLFVANFGAIVALSVLLFVALGFDTVDSFALVDSEVRSSGMIGWTATRIERLFASAYGPAFRLIMPLLFVAAIFVPLRRALVQVTWQVRARSSIESILNEIAPSDRAVRSSLNIGQQSISLRLVLVDHADHAQRVEETLRQRIAAATGVMPSIHVAVVPDFESLRIIADEQAATAAPLPARPVLPDVSALRVAVDEAVRAEWPTAASGALLEWRLGPVIDGHPTLDVFHLGAPLGAAGETLLGSAVSQHFASSVTVRDHAFDASALTRGTASDSARWVDDLVRVIDRARDVDALHVCVTLPPLASLTPEPDAGSRFLPVRVDPALESERTLLRFARDLLARENPERIHVRDGAVWSLRVSLDACPAPVVPVTATDASAASDAAR